MKTNKGVIGIGLLVAIVLGIVVVGGGAYYLGRSDSGPKVINPENILPSNENQELPVVENKQETKKVVDSTSADAPLITSISPSFGSIGTIIELKGNNLAGFEGGLDAIIKNDKGETAFLKGIGLVPREDKTIRVKIEEKVCKQNNSYSGEACKSWLNLIPGTYKIYTMPWGKKSNEVNFVIGYPTMDLDVMLSNIGLKRYSNDEYGFIFNYPISWKLNEDKNKKEVTISTNDIANIADGGHPYPSWSITFKSTDKTFFNNITPTKMGVITYNEKESAIFADDRCIKAEKLFGNLNGSNDYVIKSIRYGGSLMSDPAYSNSAILTSNGKIIIVNSQQGVASTPELENQLSSIAKTFGLLNGNTVFVPACAK